MVKGKTKSGIKFQIDERIKDDARLLHCLVDLQSDDTDNQLIAIYRLLELLFGGKAGVIQFENAVASAHDGICTSELLMSELNEIFSKLNLKKS